MTRDASAGLRPMVILLVLLLSLGWGFNWPIMKIALVEFPVWTFRAVSCVAAGLCLLVIAWVANGGALTPDRREWPQLMLAALFNVTGWHMLIGYGVPLVPAGHAAVLAYTMPLWVVVLGTLVFRQPLELTSVFGLMLGTAGIVILVLPDLESLGAAPLGSGLVLLAALSWAIGTLIQKRLVTRLPTLALTGWQLVLGSVPMLLLMPFVDGLHAPNVSALAWAAGIYVTIVALVICYFLWFKIVSLLSASKASIATFLTPAVGIVSGALLLGEPFGIREMLALAFIAAAIFLVLTPPARETKEADA